MSKKMLVTPRQAVCVQQMANDKKVGRELFQASLDNGDFARFLDDVKAGTVGISAPPGARIHIVRGVRVKQDRPWQEGVNAAGPNTPSDYNVRKVSDLYVPVGNQEVTKDFILLNYPQGGGGWDNANAWAQAARLKGTNPREVFAVGEQHPTLHNILGQNPMYVVATTECFFDGYRQACYVWWNGSDRKACLYWVSCFDRTHDWFAFSK